MARCINFHFILFTVHYHVMSYFVIYLSELFTPLWNLLLPKEPSYLWYNFQWINYTTLLGLACATLDKEHEKDLWKYNSERHLLEQTKRRLIVSSKTTCSDCVIGKNQRHKPNVGPFYVNIARNPTLVHEVCNTSFWLV